MRTSACIAFDEGKNQWYHSFSMSLEDPLASDPEDGLLANLSDHGNMLNQPEVNWMTGEFFDDPGHLDMWDFGDYNYRDLQHRDRPPRQPARPGHLQGPEGLRAEDLACSLPTWKQGHDEPGWPGRRHVTSDRHPERLDRLQDGNPYAFRNMDCDNWLYAAGDNPFYPDGLCGDSAINLSSVIPDTAVDSQTVVRRWSRRRSRSVRTSFAIGDTNPILQGQEVEPNTTKVTRPGTSARGLGLSRGRRRFER